MVSGRSFLKGRFAESAVLSDFPFPGPIEKCLRTPRTLIPAHSTGDNKERPAEEKEIVRDDQHEGNVIATVLAYAFVLLILGAGTAVTLALISASGVPNDSTSIGQSSLFHSGLDAIISRI